jgi:hypothetical protein
MTDSKIFNISFVQGIIRSFHENKQNTIGFDNLIASFYYNVYIKVPKTVKLNMLQARLD